MTARQLSRYGLVLAFVLVADSAALAAPPPTLHKIDRTAPCFGWPAVDLDQDGVFDRLDRCDNTPAGAIVDKWGCPLDRDQDGVFDGLDKCPDTPQGERVDKQGCSRVRLSGSSHATTEARATPAPMPPPPVPSPAVSETERQLVEGGKVRLENVYFETNSANLLPESEATLREVGDVLEKFVNLRVEVQGHTDTRGSAAYNLKLSQIRAESVRNYLLLHFKLQDNNVSARGYGEKQPETAEKNAEERLRNRRVVLKALNPDVLPKNVRLEQR